MEKIIAIEDLDSYKLKDANGWGRIYEGFKVTTTDQEIYLLIDSEQSCCERVGHICSEDDFSEFLGLELLKIDIVDTSLNKRTALAESETAGEGEAMFINLETSGGTLQFALYNAHNGYYGHDVKIISKQLTKGAVL